MQFRLVTPKGEKFVGEVTQLTAPGGMGQIGILPGHAALISTIEVGILSLTTASKERKFAVNRGFVHVLEDKVELFTHTCEFPEEIDISRAEAALSRAKTRLRIAQEDPTIDVARARYAMQRALTRLTVAGRKILE